MRIKQFDKIYEGTPWKASRIVLQGDLSLDGHDIVSELIEVGSEILIISGEYNVDFLELISLVSYCHSTGIKTLLKSSFSPEDVVMMRTHKDEQWAFMIRFFLVNKCLWIIVQFFLLGNY